MGQASTANGSARICLRIPAKAEYIALGRLALTGLSQVNAMSEETLADLKLALTEACTNSVRHAYGGGSGTVEISYVLSRDRLVIEVADGGPGFTLDLDPGTEGDLTEGGLGLAIIRALTDELEFAESDSGAGSKLRLVKFLQA